MVISKEECSVLVQWGGSCSTPLRPAAGVPAGLAMPVIHYCATSVACDLAAAPSISQKAWAFLVDACARSKSAHGDMLELAYTLAVAPSPAIAQALF